MWMSLCTLRDSPLAMTVTCTEEYAKTPVAVARVWIILSSFSQEDVALVTLVPLVVHSPSVTVRGKPPDLFSRLVLPDALGSVLVDRTRDSSWMTDLKGSFFSEGVRTIAARRVEG